MKRLWVVAALALVMEMVGCGGARKSAQPSASTAAPASPQPVPSVGAGPTVTLRADPPTIAVGAYTHVFWTFENRGKTPLILRDSGDTFTATMFGPDGKVVLPWVDGPQGDTCAQSEDQKYEPPSPPLPPITVAPGARYQRDLWWTALSYALPEQPDICGTRTAAEQGTLPPGTYQVTVQPPLSLQGGILPVSIVTIVVQ